MREQYHIVQCIQGFRNLWLGFKHIKAGTTDSSVDERIRQGCLVNNCAAGNIDQKSLRSKCAENFTGNEMVRTRAPRGTTGPNTDAQRHAIWNGSW